MDNSNQPSQMQQPANTIPPTDGNSSKSVFVPIGLGMVVVLVAIGAYLLGTKQNQPVVQNSVQTTPIPSPTPLPDETASWKTYSSSQYKYSLKHPSTLDFSTSTYQGTGGLVNTDTWTGQDKSYTVNVFSYKSGVKSKLEFNTQAQPTETIRIDNQTVNKIVSVDETLIHVGPINYGGYEYMIVFTSGITKNDEGLSLFDQILSTFQFTDKARVTPTETVEGKFCGGIAANLPENKCPLGYKCQLDGNYPDSGGKCVKL